MVSPDARPKLTITRAESGAGRARVELSGRWTALELARHRARGGRVARLPAGVAGQDLHWDLSAIDRIDHVGGRAVWQLWRGALPGNVTLTATQQELFERLADFQARIASLDRRDLRPQHNDPVTRLGLALFGFASHLFSGVALLGDFVLNLLRILQRPALAPWRELSANVYAVGAQAMPILAVVATLIGVVLSYLSAQQLKTYGAGGFVINILGLSIIRELGPVLAAILVAGRSGSAITARLGVMRVTEELDAMRVMGISHGMRLILPRVLALGIAMPLLVVWTDAVALGGGMLAAHLELGIDPGYFLHSLPGAVPLANVWIGLGKGVAFGMLIALVACHYGLRIKPNAQSLGEGTTASVVAAITGVIIADAIFAIAFQGVGYR